MTVTIPWLGQELLNVDSSIAVSGIRHYLILAPVHDGSTSARLKNNAAAKQLDSLSEAIDWYIRALAPLLPSRAACP